MYSLGLRTCTEQCKQGSDLGIQSDATLLSKEYSEYHHPGSHSARSPAHKFFIPGNYRGALWIFLAAGGSDAFDGYIAKHFDMCIRFGSFLDPLADKLLLVLSVVILARSGSLPFWLAATLVARDVIIVVGAGAYYLAPETW